MEGKLYPAASFWTSASPPVDRAAAIAIKSRHAPLNLKRFMTLLQRMTLSIYYPSVDPIYKLPSLTIIYRSDLYRVSTSLWLKVVLFIYKPALASVTFSAAGLQKAAIDS
jgi:hypothetical protein